MVYAQSKRIYAQWKNGAKRNGSDRQEPDHDLRPEERRHLYCRVQNGRGGGALAISIPASETMVVRYFQERMPYGLFVPDVGAIK
jgi:hypothetical protein